MKLQETKFIAKLTLILAIALLTACGTTKSSDVSEQSSLVTDAGSKPLASCNGASNSNMTFYSSIVADSAGNLSGQYIKVKFTNIASSLAGTGYYLRFYKWRVINGTSQLDSNPLYFTVYNLSTKTNITSSASAYYTNQVSSSNGFYIDLRDDASSPYQVLKAVIYKTDGTIAAQTNMLIPQFLANPSDYKTNSDGTTRATSLQNLHPLLNSNTSGWTDSQFQQAFDQYCF